MLRFLGGCNHCASILYAQGLGIRIPGLGMEMVVVGDMALSVRRECVGLSV